MLSQMPLGNQCACHFASSVSFERLSTSELGFRLLRRGCVSAPAGEEIRDRVGLAVGTGGTALLRGFLTELAAIPLTRDARRLISERSLKRPAMRSFGRARELRSELG